jgi:hypothetical protein
VVLSFEKLFKDDLTSKDFSSARYVRDYKGRPNISKSALDADSNTTYLDNLGTWTTRYVDALSVRYVSVLNLSYDFLVSFFDVNTHESLVCRTFRSDAATKSLMTKYLSLMKPKKPNIEARIIGMQTGQDYSNLYDLAELIDSHRVQLVEVDLFGSDVRHVAFDTKLGMSFEVLVEDILYKPGEFRNTMTLEQFERGMSIAHDETGTPLPKVSIPELG